MVVSPSWTALAGILGGAINARYFEAHIKDNGTTTSLHLRDANSLFLLLNLAPNTSIPSITTRKSRAPIQHFPFHNII